MLINPWHGASTVAPAAVGAHVEWFHAFLKHRHVSLSPSCRFARSLARLAELRHAVRDGRPLARGSKKVQRAFVADAFGADMLTALIRRTSADTAERFAGHWPLFRSADAVQTREGEISVERDKLWELFVGAAVADFAGDVRSEEPDVTCDFRGVRWGIACKTLHSNKPEKHVKRLVEGARQLEDARVQYGIVAVNLANVLPHARLFDAAISWDFSRGGNPVVEYVTRLARAIVARIPEEPLASRLAFGRLAERRRTRALVFFCPTIMHVDGRPMLVCATYLHEFRHVQHEMERRFALAFNEAIGSAMGYVAPPNSPVATET